MEHNITPRCPYCKNGTKMSVAATEIDGKIVEFFLCDQNLFHREPITTSLLVS